MRTAWVVTLLAAAAAPARAQERLTLADAIRESLEHNAGLRARRSDVDEQAARASEVHAGWFPRLSVSELWQRGNQPVFVFSSLLASRRFTADDFAIDALNHPDPTGFFRASFGAEQLLFDGGRQRAATAAADLQRDVAGFVRDEAAAALVTQATAAYGRILTAEAGHRAAAAAREAIQQDRTRAEQRRETGMATDADVLALAARAADLEQRVLQYEGDAAIARAELNRLMGAEVSREYGVEEPAPPPPGGASADLPALVAEAEVNRPEVRRAAAARALADADSRGARAMLLPQIAVQGAVDLSGTQFVTRASNWIVGGEARWSLSLGGAERARLRAAGAGRARAQAEADDARAAVHVEVATAFHQRRSAAARQAAGRAAVDQARESERVLRDRFEAGLATIADVLTASSAVVAAESQRVSAAVDLMMSEAMLRRAVGRLPAVSEVTP